MTVTGLALNHEFTIFPMYPTCQLMGFISPLDTLPTELFNESPFCATYTITLGLYGLF
jgi:hypothetical protein